MIIAQKIDDIIGKVTPPIQNSLANGDPIEALGKVIGVGINLFITAAGLFLLVYLLWGAFDWITSSGEKEKIQKAQNKMTYALVGIVLVFIVISVFGIITGNILGIVENTPTGWKLKISTFQ